MFHIRYAVKSISNKHFCKNFEKFSRCFSAPTDYEIKFKPQYNTEESEKILNILNGSNVESDLKRYKIPQNRIKNIKSWVNKKGPFQSLNDILEVEGLSVKVLEKLCENIINNSANQLELKETEEGCIKLSKRQYLSPPILENVEKLSTVVSLHLTPMGVSWTRLSRDDHVDKWDFYGFAALPKKVLPVDTFQLAIKILERLPSGDVYILEGSNNSGGSLQNGKSSLVSTQQLELTSMLIALINTSQKHNASLQNDDVSKKAFTNKVYFLKCKLPARLFGTLIGQERVSANQKITELLNEPPNTTARPYSAITLIEGLKNTFLAHNAVNKELLGQPLMLAIAFMDICVKKKPAACRTITVKGK